MARTATTTIERVDSDLDYECYLDGCETEQGRRLHGHGDRYVQRFWTKVNRHGPLPEVGTLAHGSGPCWEWRDAPMVEGYGRFRAADGRTADGNVYAHRYMYEHAYGEIPEGYEVDHLCNMRNCVNPVHLEAVPSLVNIQRSWDLRRHRRTLGLGPRTNYIQAERDGIDRDPVPWPESTSKE